MLHFGSQIPNEIRHVNLLWVSSLASDTSTTVPPVRRLPGANTADPTQFRPALLATYRCVSLPLSGCAGRAFLFAAFRLIGENFLKQRK